MISMKYIFNVNKDFISFNVDNIDYSDFKNKYDILLKEAMSIGEVLYIEFEGFIGDNRILKFKYDNDKIYFIVD